MCWGLANLTIKNGDITVDDYIYKVTRISYQFYIRIIAIDAMGIPIKQSLFRRSSKDLFDTAPVYV